MKIVTLAYYLEMLSSGQARLWLDAPPGTSVGRAGPEHAEIVRRLYQEIGQAHFWTSRALWRQEDFALRLQEPNVHVLLAQCLNSPAGFAELIHHADRTVQLVFLGIRPGFAGRGLGKYLLSLAIQEAWRVQATRIWLTTRTFDSQYALQNYVKRGFRVYKVRPEVIHVPLTMKQTARELVQQVKERGRYPPLSRRVEGYLRDSTPGRTANMLLYRWRRLMGHLAARHAGVVRG